MDNANLNNLLLNFGERQFWIKPIGDPSRSPDEEKQIFDDSKVQIDFSERPSGISLGDILIVYRIEISKILFVAEAVSSPHQATSDEIKKHPWKERWSWSIESRNLTPNFGARWSDYSLKPFSLVEEFNDLNPQEKVSLNGLKRGKDKLRISEDFGKFLIKEIQQFEQ